MNNVELIGRFVADPKMFDGGVATFTLAVDRHDKDKNTDFPHVKVFGKQAETVCKYLKKGSQCAVQGRLETGSYKNKKGEDVYYTDVVAFKVEFLGGGNGGSQKQEEPKKEAEPTKEKTEPVEEQTGIDDFEYIDEDVPF